MKQNASSLAGCMITVHSSLSIFTHNINEKFRLDFCWCNACKSEMSIFQTHAGEYFLCFIIMILMSPHPHPNKALQCDRRSWRKKKLQLPASCRKNAEKIFSTMDHYQTPSKRETSSSIGVKFILFQNFFAILS